MILVSFPSGVCIDHIVGNLTNNEEFHIEADFH